MLYLVTGLPGAGKTLYTVSWLPTEFVDKNGMPRDVYYNGIRDLKLPWHELAKPEDWPTVPDGSVVVLDEAQRCMRVRAPGAKVPDHVQLLETHRHRGLDVVIITQHPNLLDTNVRRLVGRHTHVRRTWGMASAKLFTWDRVGDPESNTDMAEAQATRWQYDKQAFASYSSAEVHTHKVRMPKRVFFAAGLLVVLVLLGWFVSSWIGKKTRGPEVGQVAGTIATAAPARDGKAKAPATYQEWTEERKPVSPEDVASSARYYPLTTPTRAPRVAACVQSAERCVCFSQQATVIPVSFQHCAEILANLRFLDVGPGGDSGWTNEQLDRAQQPDRNEVAGPSGVAGRAGGGAVQPAAPVSLPRPAPVANPPPTKPVF